METFRVSPEKRDRFEEDGFVIFQNLIDTETIEDLVDRIDGLLEGRYVSSGIRAGLASTETEEDEGKYIKHVAPTTWKDNRLYIEDPVLKKISKNPILSSIAAQLLGSEDVGVFQQQALLKDPGYPNPTPWHQDDHYWETGGYAVTVWLPLEAVSRENGTMSLLPGSHKWEVLEHVSAKGESKFKTVKEELDESKFFPLELNPGSVSFHHSKIVHGAFANMGKERRIALAQHYAAPREYRNFAERFLALRREERLKKEKMEG